MKSSAKHFISSVKTGEKKARALVIVIISLILATAIAVGAVAVLRDTSSTVTEELTKAEVTCEVNEDWSVTNTSNIPVLIRVRVIVNMTDEDGDIIPGDTPDYTVGSGWTVIGDYLYYNGIVSNEDGENATAPAISYTGLSDGGDRVTLLAEAIQAASDAAEESWGLKYSDGSWS